MWPRIALQFSVTQDAATSPRAGGSSRRLAKSTHGPVGIDTVKSKRVHTRRGSIVPAQVDHLVMGTAGLEGEQGPFRRPTDRSIALLQCVRP